MKSFKLEFIEFIASLDSKIKTESWGVFLGSKKIGFALHPIAKGADSQEDYPENFHIIHIWEDLWIKKINIIKSRITSLFNTSDRVFARKTQVVKLNKIELLDFLTKNHLNEPANGKHKYGLMFNDELVAVAAFSASCPVHRNGEVYKSHQLIRFCNKNGKTVVGGLSKLLSYFIKKHAPEDIMSYADMDWSNGKSYNRLGFQKIGLLAPQTFYIDPSTMGRLYKLDSLEEKSGLLKFSNQGSIKYLLDLKQSVDGQ